MRISSKYYVTCSMEILFIVLSLLLTTFYILPVYAAEPSLSATPSASIKTKLEELKKEIASKAAKLKLQIDKKLRDKAYVGILKNKSDTSLTLAASSGPKIVNINQDTIFQSKLKNKKFSRQTLTSEDYIACLGDQDETGVLTAKKVILLPPSLKPQKTFLWGQIISTSDNLITLKNSDSINVAVSSPKRAKFKINDLVILTGSLNKNKVFEAEFLYVIPQGVNLKTKKDATTSAKPTSSPTPSPSLKATPR